MDFGFKMFLLSCLPAIALAMDKQNNQQVDHITRLDNKALHLFLQTEKLLSQEMAFIQKQPDQSEQSSYLVYITEIQRLIMQTIALKLATNELKLKKKNISALPYTTISLPHFENLKASLQKTTIEAHLALEKEIKENDNASVTPLTPGVVQRIDALKQIQSDLHTITNSFDTINQKAIALRTVHPISKL